jgi:hypothetical protein
MRISGVAMVAAVLLATPVPARAAVTPTGEPCDTVAWAPADGVSFAVLAGGPVVLANDAAPATLATGTITCSLQGPYYSTHADPDLVRVTSAPAPAVAVLPPTYTPVTGEPWYLCSQVDVAGDGTWYWDDVAGAWTRDAAGQCTYLGAVPDMGCMDCDPYPDALLCPLFAEAFPPEGDIVLPVVGPFWDCPPYGNV